jgi:hypothetical protein
VCGLTLVWPLMAVPPGLLSSLSPDYWDVLDAALAGCPRSQITYEWAVT